jgi:16S rRNA (guanine(966)-N(2))-methyltransferase RsmD
MRIIGGTKAGYSIKAPKNLPIRPITDRSKESLFNSITHQYDIENCKVLDLFSGSGCISLEFASRGAKDIVSIDLNLGCVNFLKSESKKLGFSQIETIKADVFKALEGLNSSFDLIFADPPYAFNQKQYNDLVLGVQSNRLISDVGTFILEHHRVTQTEHLPGFLKSKAYGQNILSYFESSTQ